MPVKPASSWLDVTTHDPSELQSDVSKVAAQLAKRLLEGKTREERLALAGALMRKSHDEAPAAIIDGPETPDELWDYVYQTYGVKIARVAVCEDHDAPFYFFCAGFFEWYPNIFEIGPRGGGKSFKMALLHHMNSRFKPGCRSSTFGAVDEQSKKVYQDMVDFFLNKGMPEGESEVLGEATQLKTIFKSVGDNPGSEVNCFPGTLAKVNGPHPPKVHSDEVEIMRALVWAESRNMAADAIMPDGRRIKAQNYATSTMKWKNGRVHKILKQFLEVKKRAYERFGGDERRRNAMIAAEAKFYVFVHCIFENAEQVSNCRCAAENAGLPEFDWNWDDTSAKCGCNMVINGFWDGEKLQDGPPRTLESVCKGKLHRSRGHRSYGEVRQLFLQNDRATWEAQQECRESEMAGVYIQSFSRSRHGIQRQSINPADGPIYGGTDWGDDHPACVLWVQYLERDVHAVRYDGKAIVMRRGSRLVFKELYRVGLTSTDLGKLVIVEETKMAGGTNFYRMPVRYRWADVQGRGDRRSWTKLGLKTRKYSTRVFEEHVKEVRGMYDAMRAYVMVDECPMYCDEVEGWRADEHGNEVDVDNHAMAAGRYVFWGMHDVYDDAGAQDPELQRAVDDARRSTDSPTPVAIVPDRETTSDQFDEEGWRAGMGFDDALV